ncbi:MAG: cob(I)yrinic acid a,c-diamide adenosyltransferase [Candidatus Eiseniibacteriota bacterium]
MKIYTKTGDDGTTGLFGNARVPKDAPRVATYGTVDEANTILGLALASGAPPELATVLLDLQARLFDLGADLATPRGGRPDPSYLVRIAESHVEDLERLIDRFEADLPPLTNFIIPGGVPTAAHLHHARAVVRRAERHLVALGREEDIGPAALRFLNRLSDLLFVLARWANRAAGVPDVPWTPRANEPED